MQYFYAILWFVIALVLLVSMSKENKVFILAGIFFLVLGAWWLADGLMPELKVFEGGWGIGLKCVTGGALAVLVAAFVKEYRKKGGDAPKDKGGE